MPEYLLVASNPDILSGMVVVRGTRIGVRFLRALRAHGAPESELLHDFPSLTPDTLQAVLELSEETITALEARRNGPLMPALVQGAEVMAELARRAHLVSAEDYATLLGRSPEDVSAADASGHLLGVPWGDRRGYPAVFMRDGRLPPGLPDALKTPPPMLDRPQAILSGIARAACLAASRKSIIMATTPEYWSLSSYDEFGPLRS